MTLHTYPEVEQGTDAWHDQRRGIVTASVVGQLITQGTIKPANNDYSRALTAVLAAERITGYTEPTYMSSDMLRGTLDEPIARMLYDEHHAPVDEVGFMVEDKWGYQIGYSPDGLVKDDGLIEIKSRRQKKHLQTILTGIVPPENMAQLQCGLLVSGREWIDYVSYCGGMPLYVIRVTPDPKWHKAIVDAVARFEENVADILTHYPALIEGLPMTERVDHFAEITV